MPGLDPGIHVFNVEDRKDVDGRNKAGHDALELRAMHDIHFIRDNPDAFDHALKRRGLGPEAKRLIALDETRRAMILELETAQARRNAASKEIGEAKRTKNEEKAAALFAEVG